MDDYFYGLTENLDKCFLCHGTEIMYIKMHESDFLSWVVPCVVCQDEKN